LTTHDHFAFAALDTPDNQ